MGFFYGKGKAEVPISFFSKVGAFLGEMGSVAKEDFKRFKAEWRNFPRDIKGIFLSFKRDTPSGK